MRIDQHPILTFDRQEAFTITCDGTPVKAYSGETVAAALHAGGIRALSRSLRYHRARGFFCAIGKCSSCMMEVNGVPNVKTCMVLAEPGMTVKTQTGRGILKQTGNRLKDPSYEIQELETDIAVVGGGPAGLSAALYASKFGARVMVFDENPHIGGQLIKQTHMFFGSREHYAKVRGIDISQKLIESMSDLVKLYPATPVIGFYPPFELAVLKDSRLTRVKAKKIIVATGASENMLVFPNNDLPGVYGAGAVQTLMNCHGILPGKTVLMIGAGNIGVIVSYQLLQAGVQVAAVVEAQPVIGAYQVHASKIRRCGVPILTRHSIQKAWGKDHVEGATIVRLDDRWKAVPGSEQDLNVDTICLAVGLSPSSEIFALAGCRMSYIPELGGEVPWRDANMMTSVEGLYVAGDVAGIEEASSAMLEGRLAGLDAVEKIKGADSDIEQLKKETRGMLHALREGPFGDKVRIGITKLAEENNS